ncbi:hypothetical protein ON010_g1145 [Phytophthora cinnamomi]|nr:hypothetical protein ON010_g1145 [Phytophthora cinnamomi]
MELKSLMPKRIVVTSRAHCLGTTARHISLMNPEPHAGALSMCNVHCDRQYPPAPAAGPFSAAGSAAGQLRRRACSRVSPTPSDECRDVGITCTLSGAVQAFTSPVVRCNLAFVPCSASPAANVTRWQGNCGHSVQQGGLETTSLVSDDATRTVFDPDTLKSPSTALTRKHNWRYP